MWCKRLEKACFGVAEVLELTERFVFVYVDKNVTPEIPKRFSVTGYPSLIVLNEKLEAIYRFKGFQEPAPFIDHLATALDRWEEYTAGRSWVPEPTRPASLVDAFPVTTFDLAFDDQVYAQCRQGGLNWFARETSLISVDPETGTMSHRLALPDNLFISDLASDGKRIYLLPSGWTAGMGILIFDPAQGAITGQVVTEANKAHKSHGARGLHAVDGKLYVLDGMLGKIHELNPTSGEILGTLQLKGKWLNGLDRLGDNWITSSRSGLHLFNPATGVERGRLDTHYQVRTLAVEDRQVMVTESFIYDFDIHHKKIQLWPKINRLYWFTWKD